MFCKTRHIISAASIIMTACSHIDTDERLIYVKPVQVAHTVLIEDFTGQRCINCPKATEELTHILEQYGEDAVIAVGIHSGPLGFHTNSRFTGLSTEDGDEYFNHWKFDYQPVGLIDRRSPMEYTAWNTSVREQIQKTAPVGISLRLNLADSLIHIQTQVSGTDGDTDGKLQLWVVEDSVTAFQLMPDGTRNDNYLHNHVFRASVNDIWGDDVSVKEGEELHKDYNIRLSGEWNFSHLSVVGFIYNQTGVLQATKTKLNNLE